jgi:hypothetical protein
MEGICTVWVDSLSGDISVPFTDFAIVTKDENGNLIVQTVYAMDGNFIGMLQKANPDITVLPVNYIEKPVCDPETKEVIRAGWTITDVDVQPIWLIQPLTGDQVTLRTSDLDNFLDNWLTITPTDKDTVLERLTEITSLLLSKYIAH